MCTMQSLSTLRCAVLAFTALVSTAAQAEELLTQIPPDAMGYVYVHNLQMVDAKVRKLASTVQYAIPRPLLLLQSVTGIGAGLKVDSDAMLVLLGDGSGSGPIQFCLWLPVSNYDELLGSLHANSMGDIAAATIVGEDVLVARRSDWALIMDPDQRDRLKELTTATPTPTPAAAPLWKDWVETNDITAVAFAPGVHQLIGLIDDGDESRDDDSPFSAVDADNRASLAAVTPPRAATGALSMLQNELRKWAASAPELVQFIQQVPAIGIGARLDLQLNAVAGMRVSLDKLEVNPLQSGDASKGELPPSAYAGGGFAVHAAGHFQPYMLSTIAAAYVRRTAADLQTDEHTILDEPALKELESAVEVAAKTVQGVELLSQPGAEAQPVYTNNCVVLRVPAAKVFVEQCGEIMRLWNKANRDAKGETRLVFDSEEKKIAERSAEQYSLDVAAMDGGPAIPEVRQAMEKLFGPGGKLQAWVVPVDERTVLLGAGTQEQMTAAMKALDEKKPIEWKDEVVTAGNSLLPAESDWQVFVDIHRYNQWRQRESAAMTGVAVIGGPLVREFPASPAIAAAGGVRESDLWIDVAAPLPTLKAATFYFTRGMRAPVQIRARTVTPVPVPAPAEPPK